MTLPMETGKQKAVRRIGESGETLVCRWLADQGYRILSRDFRTRRGELDIVAQHGNVVAFVEVKTRTTSAKGQGAMAVGPAKQFHLRKAAQAWLLANPWARDLLPRFDVVEVRLQRGYADILHIPGAFECDA